MQKSEKYRDTIKRKRWFKIYKCIIRPFIKKPRFKYLGEKISEPSIILSNHVGAKAPLSWEIFFKHPFRFWGTYEMTSGIKSVYKYLSTTYFHQKKHMNRVLAKIIAFVACPFVNLFYKGMRLIPTYRDARLKGTINQSEKTIEKGGNLIIFPEDSAKGYFDTLKTFYGGFVVFAERMLNKGKDLRIYVAYLHRKAHTFIIDKPQRYSSLRGEIYDKNVIAEKLCHRANELAVMPL